ncbi:MAG: alpha/beta hydrolase [Gammaproteobacteria bacterium]|nr:alpha/beta hydrolase [Gammaproteobacteria bacterium]
MTGEAQVHVISAKESSVVDVIFVHGLEGEAINTWSNDESEDFWPKWLLADLKKVSIFTLGYPAFVFKKPSRIDMDLIERAANILEQLANHGIGKKPIVFVTHSLGGLLVKLILRKSTESEDEDRRRIARSVRLVFFIATPHLGSGLAKLAKAIPNTSKLVSLLANETGLLEDLNEHYRKFANNHEDLNTVTYYEKNKTKNILVVTRESADPGVAGSSPTAVDRDHMSICKPTSRNDIVYMGVKRHIDNLVLRIEESGRSAFSEYYLEKSSDDRRDLHRKLLDARREHEYGYANNAQNSFARRYSKTGLFGSARNSHDALLSEVETRFVTHVYHPLICQSASYSSIAQALQDLVIDPLAGKQIGDTKFDAKSILSAVYFLTEQCYIRWDVPV